MHIVLLILLVCMCGLHGSQGEEVYGSPQDKEILTDSATLEREFDLDLRPQHDLTSHSVIPQEQLLKIIAGAEKGNKGTH
jgi:hypothetical protein